jgi:hypothetical protein
MTATLATRAMQTILTRALRLYPPHTRAWGEAIVAESDSITEFTTAFSWTLGGLMVAFRAFFSNLIRRPAANNEPALLGPPPLPPPLPWKLALVCLAIAGGLLFVPDLRQGLSVTFSTWRSQLKLSNDTALWEKIAHEAESKGEAEAMAFAAMRLGQDSARFDEAVRLADHAVAKDPSLTWIYYFLTLNMRAPWFHASPHPELAQRLQEWDPQNAAPYLAEAEYIANVHVNDPQWRKRYISLDTPLSQEDLVRLRARDPRWLELMARAFAAPMYSNYFDRRLDFDLQVMQRLGVMNPQRAMTTYLDDETTLSFFYLREYAALRIAQGEEAERAGQWENAASEYWSVAQFGRHARLGGISGYFDRDIGWSLQEASYKHLQPVLFKLGRVQEAQAVVDAAQLQHVERDEMHGHVRSEWQRLLTFSVVNALFIHSCAIVLEASFLLMVVIIVAFALRRAPRFVRFTLTYAPPPLLLSCIGLLGAYHPYAEYYRLYLAYHPARDFESVVNFLMLCDVSQNGTITPVHFWWAILAAVGAIGIWLASKTVWRTMRQQHD